MLKCPYCKNELKSINLVAPGVVVYDNYAIEDGCVDPMDCQRMDEMWDFVNKTEVQCPICGEELPTEVYSKIKDIGRIMIGEYY